MIASMFSERARLYLQDIVDNANLLIGFVQGMDVEALADDQKTLLAVERLFQRITEAVVQIGGEDMARIGEDIPVGRIRAFGNRLRHDYRTIDPQLLLLTAQNDLPMLRDAALRALRA